MTRTDLHLPSIGHRRLNAVDRVGATLSFICALHCALQPLLLAVLPLMGLGVLLDERLETVFLGFSILLAGSSVISGWKHHGRPQALPLLAIAVALIVSSRIPAFEAQEMPLAVAGALSIMSSHLLNLWLHKRYHHHDHGHGHSHAAETITPSDEPVAA